jgi:homoserine dehydrogenase
MTPSPRIRFANSARPVRTLGLGVIGLGTVGTGTLKVLAEHRREIQRRLGCNLQLKVICSRSVHKRDLSWLGQPVKITSDWRKVVHDPEVHIVVELVGVLSTARAIAFAVLDAGKHLVTANKQLVAEHGAELVSAAARTTWVWASKRVWPAEPPFCTRCGKGWRVKTLPRFMAS